MIHLLQKRRSIRKYLAEDVEEEKIRALIEAALRSPSSRRLNPWMFYIVENKAILQKLSECKPHGAEFLKDAPLGIIVCGDPAKSDVWIEDCSIASIIIQLTAETLGLGSCWIQIRNRMYAGQISSEHYIQKLIKIPEKYSILSIISIGYPAEDKPGHQTSLEEKKIVRILDEA